MISLPVLAKARSLPMSGVRPVDIVMTRSTTCQGPCAVRLLHLGMLDDLHALADLVAQPLGRELGVGPAVQRGVPEQVAGGLADGGVPGLRRAAGPFGPDQVLAQVLPRSRSEAAEQNRSR